jgi:cell division transport system permease protein
MDMGRRGILVVGTLLGLAVLLIVGNTIRLDIQNRREEIEVSKLIGGTDAFIRRPFLYTGLWYGLLGALLAWILVGLGFWLVDEPARRLAGLYDSSFLLSGLSWQGTGILLLTGIALGLAGSWLAVGRHLSVIEPT